MTLVNTKVDFEDADAFYASLAKALDATQSDRQALRLTLRLTIILASQIGSKTALGAAIEIAQEPVFDVLQIGDNIR